MDVARLNFSHGTYEEHRERIANIRKAAKAVGKTIAILLDTQGPEIRTKSFKGGEAYLTEGSRVIITTEDVEGTEKRFSITYKELMYDVEIGTNISLDDGLINLKVVGIDKEKGEISTTVLNSGYIKNKKGVNVPNVRVNLPSLTEKDRRDILFGIEHEVDFIAASFVRDTNDVLSMRQLLEENDANYIHIISKIENREAVTNFEQILQASDGIMVARGDLGVEIPPEEVPIVQKNLIEKCNLVGKPVITATQMLDSMQSEPRPTRAEASDVANAILDGTDAIMLSGETAAGKFPVEAVRMMSVIAEKTEPTLDHMSLLQERKRSISMTITDAISQSVTQTALNLDVSSIITPTQSGHSARMIAKYRPEVPIIAVTFDEFVYRQLSLVWGVHAVISKEIESTDELLDEAVKKGLSTKLFHRGSKVIITAGVPVGVSGTTNLMKVHVIGNVIATGQGIGRHYAYGKAVVATSADEAIDKMTDGAILVTTATDKDMIPAIEKAGGIVTEESGMTSHAAIVGLSLGIPVIVGIDKATKQIEDGEMITIDAGTGNIHQGHASVL